MENDLEALEAIHDEMKMKLVDITDNLTRMKNALGFVADRVQDNQASANISVLEDEMERIITQIKLITSFKEDTPFD